MAVLASETGHVPPLHRTYPGNGSDQAVLGSCLDGLGRLHAALEDTEQRGRPGSRTPVRDGGSRSEQWEPVLDSEGHHRLISLRLSRGTSEAALAQAAPRGAMKPVGGKLGGVRAARLRLLERTRLGQRVLCTDRHAWSTGRIIHAFRGQWNAEELFRRAKKGGVAPWGPSHQWADGSLRLHTFATVIGLMLVRLARVALGGAKSARGMMRALAGIEAAMVQVRAKQRGRRATVLLAPDPSAEQRKAVQMFDLGRWMPTLLSSGTPTASNPSVERVA